MSANGVCGGELWILGGVAIDDSPPLCRTVVVDGASRTRVAERVYQGEMDDPPPLAPGQFEATCASRGALRVTGAGHSLESPRRWVWSERFQRWEQGGHPPEDVLEAVRVAMGG